MALIKKNPRQLARDKKDRERRKRERRKKSTKTPTKKVTTLPAINLGKISASEADRTSQENIARAPQVTTLPTIELNKPKEKTGISKLREEDSVVGQAIKVATDWKTTVALVATLTTLGIAGVAGTGAGIVGKAGATTLARSSTGAIIGKVATNPKTIALTTSLLKKAGMTAVVAGLVATVAGTYPFAEFELAEATDKIGIAIFQASNEGDLEEVRRLQEILEDMVNPSVWDSIVGKIPFANVLNSVKKNIAAAQVSAKSILQSTEKKLAAAEAKAAEPTFAEEREQADIESFERKREFAEEESERFEKIEKDRRQQELLDRAEDSAFWEGEAKKRRALELVQMAEDTAFFKDIADQNRARKLKERAEDEAYWAKIKGEALDNEELEMLRAWNAGKSSLNFKWLGL